jgi:hypothetical protein
MNWLRKCGVYVQWNYIQLQKKNEILLFASKWMELESFNLSEVSQFQKAKIIFSTYHRKYVEYKYKKYYEKQVKLRGSHI